jgi:hypothetical protein
MATFLPSELQYAVENHGLLEGHLASQQSSAEYAAGNVVLSNTQSHKCPIGVPRLGDARKHLKVQLLGEVQNKERRPPDQ